MDIKEIKNEGLSREFEIKVPANEVENKVKIRLKEVAKNIKLPGFRPGKVPVNIVKQKHGGEIITEVLQQVVSDTSKKVLDDKKLNPAMQPKIEIDKDYNPNEAGSDLTYNISFEIYPDVPEIDLKELKGENLTVDVSDKDIDDAIKKVADSRKNFGKLKRQRKARKGDAVKIDFVGKKDGVEFEGGSSKDFQLELGSGQFIPGFEDQLIGAKKDEEVLVKVTFPENYGSKDLAGQDVEFEVKVHEVLEAQEVEIDDEFAKSLGLEGLDKLKEAIKEQIENDFLMIARTKLKKDIFDYLDENCKFDVPESMVDLEYKSILETSKKEQQAENNNEKLTKEQEDEFKSLAERRVRLGIILAEIGRKNSLEVTASELQKAAFETARRYPGQEKQIFEYYSKNRQALDQLKGPILEEKVVDYIVENSSLKENKKTTDELLKIQEEMSDDS